MASVGFQRQVLVIAITLALLKHVVVGVHEAANCQAISKASV